MVEIIGMVAGVFTTFAFFPQVLKTVKSRSTDDLSWTWLVMTICGVFLWLVYGVYIKSISLIVANGITLCSVVVLFGIKYHNYSKTRSVV